MTMWDPKVPVLIDLVRKVEYECRSFNTNS